MHHDNGREDRPQVRMRLSREVRALLKAEVERRPMTSESVIIETAVKQLLSPEVKQTHLDTQLLALRKEISQLANAPRPAYPNLSSLETRLANTEHLIGDMRQEISHLRQYLRGAEKRYFMRLFSTVAVMLLAIGAGWWFMP